MGVSLERPPGRRSICPQLSLPSHFFCPDARRARTLARTLARAHTCAHMHAHRCLRFLHLLDLLLVRTLCSNTCPIDRGPCVSRTLSTCNTEELRGTCTTQTVDAEPEIRMRRRYSILRARRRDTRTTRRYACDAEIPYVCAMRRAEIRMRRRDTCATQRYARHATQRYPCDAEIRARRRDTRVTQRYACDTEMIRVRRRDTRATQTKIRVQRAKILVLSACDAKGRARCRDTHATQRYARDAEIRAAHDNGDTARYACNVEIPYRCDTVPHRDTHATKRYTGNAEIHPRRIDTRTTQR